MEAQDDVVAQDPWAVRLAPLWAALLAMAPFAAVLAGQTEFFYDDHFRFSTPIAAMFAEAVRGHHLPLWNPWILTGTPLVAERGSMVAHPGMFLALVMEPSHAIGTLMVLLLGVLAAGGTALLRALAVRPWLAVGLGAALGLSGPALSYTSNAPFLGTLAWWPLTLLCSLRLAQGRRAAWTGGLTLGLALLGGDLPGALLLAVVALLVFRAAGGRLRVAWPRLLGVGAIALVVGAGSWYPVVWALPLSERGAGIAATEAGQWSFHPAELLGFLWPHPLGLPLPRFTLWPFRWLKGERLFLHSVWVGALVASASLLAVRRRAERVPRTLVVTALVLLVMATGEHTGLWLVLRPLFTYLRYPSKLAGPAALLIALAGGIVLDRLLAEPRRLRNLALVVAALGALGASAGVAAQSWLAERAGAGRAIGEAAAQALRADTVRVTSIAVAVVALCMILERGRLSLARATAVLALLLFLDVAAATAELSWTRPMLAPARPAYLPEGTVRGPRVMRLAEVSLGRLALDDNAFSHEQLRQAALLLPMRNAVHHAAVLDPYGLYLGEVASGMAELANRNPLALAEVSASDLVLATPTARAPWLVESLQSGRLVPTASLAAGAVVLRPSHAWPRSFLATAVSLVPSREIPGKLAEGAPRVLVAAGRGLRDGGFVPLAPGALPESLLAAPAAAVTPVSPTAWRPGEAHYRVTVSAPALLVEMDAFMPGWRVFVDGEERLAVQANLFGHAVVVPVGEHEVTWRFLPRLAAASLITSWLGLLLVVAVVCLRGCFPHRRRPSPG